MTEVRNFIIIGLAILIIPWLISYTVGFLINVQVNCDQINKSYAQVIPHKCQ